MVASTMQQKFNQLPAQYQAAIREIRAYATMPPEQQQMNPLSPVAQFLASQLPPSQNGLAIPSRQVNEQGAGNLRDAPVQMSLTTNPGIGRDVKHAQLDQSGQTNIVGKILYKTGVVNFIPRGFALNVGDQNNVLNYNEQRQYLYIANRTASLGSIYVLFVDGQGQTLTGITSIDPAAIEIAPGQYREFIRRVPINGIILCNPTGTGVALAQVIEG